MKLAWLTDLHLNFVDPAVRTQLYTSIRDAGTDAVLLGGDIGEADSLTHFLEELLQGTGRPVYFVLGNHDYYGASIEFVRQRVATLSDGMWWLPSCGPVYLTERTALVGHDGWADARFGDFFGSPVVLNDFVNIQDLAKCAMNKECLYHELQRLGDESAQFIEYALRIACTERERVILLTHVPPFREACWHEGRLSDDRDWLPHFTCKAMGDAILRVMESFPHRKLIVLCGHTHGSGVAQVAPNIVVKTGGAVYGSPQVQQILEL
jgi:Icc-related predicted phosphoesterase